MKLAGKTGTTRGVLGIQDTLSANNYSLDASVNPDTHIKPTKSNQSRTLKASPSLSYGLGVQSTSALVKTQGPSTFCQRLLLPRAAEALVAVGQATLVI
ncbi:hypothetical protein CEXT_150531 [Caerostris extrusa]|uniref:Uncharacterized protein n=1 Tax=Caerostris extrusa TaxID=172846 RepID=A0AAV4QAS2_CAEEX|nr:hypothetical protein CEXT_150531 [Caerostris extrusa]